MKVRMQQRGDTIVEVIIAMAIAAFVLGAAYALVNRTLNNSQQAQEHSEALKVAEGQVELIKSKDISLAVGTKVFCMTSDASGVQVVPFTGAVTVPSDPASYPVGCKDLGLAGFFRAAIIKDDKSTASPLDDSYVVTVDWPGATGGEDKISLSYRKLSP